VYVDTDVECLRPIDDVLGEHDFVCVCLKPGRVTNTLIAAAPGHPLLDRALREVRPMEVYWTTWSDVEALKEAAGPPLLRRLVRDHPDVRLLAPAVLFPSTPAERESAVGVHHIARSWHNATAARNAMLQAERRLEEARAELAKEKRAHEATKKRLARLEDRIERLRSGKGGIRDKLALLRRSG
jgi:hypothetical protein